MLNYKFIRHFCLLALLSTTPSCFWFNTKVEEDKQVLPFRSFNIYDATISELMEKIAEHYDLNLDDELDDNEQRYSLSVQNASIEDILLKISHETGYHCKIEKDTIIIQDNYFREDLSMDSLQLNENFWLDIANISPEIKINELTVANFFAPLLQDVVVKSLDNSTGKIVLQGPTKKIAYFKESLKLLNYSVQNRTSSLTFLVINKSQEKLFMEGKLDNSQIEFAWKLNIGDELSIKTDKGIETNITSKLTTATQNSSIKEAQFTFSYGANSLDSSVDINDPKMVKLSLSETQLLVVKCELYINGNKLIAQNLNSKILATSDANIPNPSFDEAISAKNLNELDNALKGKNLQVRIVSLTLGGSSDLQQFQGKISNAKTAAEIIEQLNQQKFHSKMDKVGLLIDCQGTINTKTQPEWQILNKALDSSYILFNNGAFKVNLEKMNPETQYLPSSPALIAPANSGILTP